MRVVVHLSDLHFGRVDYRLLGPLGDAIREAGPHVVAISGDLTQRARAREFREARDFLATLPRPQIVVPGNHDVPLDDPVARFFYPLRHWRQYIGEELEPVYQDKEIIVAGVNTARSLTWKGGRINRSQVEWVLSRICESDDRMTKIVVTHHPFDVPAGHTARDVLGRARMAMAHFARCGADIFLAGHLHLGYITRTAERYRIQGHSALVVQAGTMSTRMRGDLNSFNVLRIEHPKVAVERWAWRAANETGSRGVFAIAGTDRFEHTPDGWQPA